MRCVAALGIELAVGGGRDDVVGVQKAVALGAVLDEGGVEAWLHVGHDPAVDVAPVQAGVGGLDLERLERRSLDDRHADLGLARRVDQHSSTQLDSLTAAGVRPATSPAALRAR